MFDQTEVQTRPEEFMRKLCVFESGIDNEKAIGKLDKSRRSNGFTKRFGKNLANSKIA
jgi:hypothetical protein